MTTATERAIEEREKRSREAAKERKIGKYAKDDFDLDEYAAKPLAKIAKKSA